MFLELFKKIYCHCENGQFVLRTNRTNEYGKNEFLLAQRFSLLQLVTYFSIRV